jgi:hypothetical protein
VEVEAGDSEESKGRRDDAAPRVIQGADRTAAAAIDGSRDASTMTGKSVMAEARQGERQGKAGTIGFRKSRVKRHDYIT